MSSTVPEWTALAERLGTAAMEIFGTAEVAITPNGFADEKVLVLTLLARSSVDTRDPQGCARVYPLALRGRSATAALAAACGSPGHMCEDGGRVVDRDLYGEATGPANASDLLQTQYARPQEADRTERATAIDGQAEEGQEGEVTLTSRQGRSASTSDKSHGEGNQRKDDEHSDPAFEPLPFCEPLKNIEC
jgi:hypothetical protein